MSIGRISFYLPKEHDKELERVLRYNRMKPNRWCRDRIMGILDERMTRKPTKENVELGIPPLTPESPPDNIGHDLGGVNG